VDEKVVAGSYRVRLAAEMRKSIRPMMKAWGFDQPPKGSPDWFGSSRLNTWVRERDGFTDEIYFLWDKYGDARYAMGMITDQVERMLAPGQTIATAAGPIHDIDILDRRLRLFGGLIDLKFEWSSGRRFLRDEIAHAIGRLKEANHFLLTGEASPYIFRRGALGRPGSGPLQPVYWYRQGETGERNRQLAEEQRAKREARRKARAESQAPRD
jgi:hypothetical protein